MPLVDDRADGVVDAAGGLVYLEHLDTPLHHARHYLGWTIYPTPDPRHRQHMSGKGARLLQVANERGITYGVVRTWPGGRTLERQLKDQHHGPRLCPMCNPRGAALADTDTVAAAGVVAAETSRQQLT